MRARPVAALLALALMLGGCGAELREADMLTIVAGMGVDRQEDGYKLTLEAVRAHDDKNEATLIESQSTTIFGGMGDSINLTGQRLYFTHADIIVLGRQLAEEGIGELISAVMRTNEVHLGIRLMVSEGEAAEILDSRALMSDIVSFELRRVLSSNNYLSKTPDIPFYRFANHVLESGIDGILPYVRLHAQGDHETQEVKGTALFRDDKLVAVIDEDASQCLLWLRGYTSSGELSRDGNGFYVSDAKGTVEADTAGARLSLKLKIAKAEGPLDESESVAWVEGFISHAVQELIDAMRLYGCDSLGIGRAINRYDPQGWKGLEPGWNDRLGTFPISVDVQVEYYQGGRTHG